MPWKPAATSDLQRENDGPRSEIVKLRHELATKRNQLRALELALRERLQKVDELNATIDRLRAANKRLDQEAEHLAQMIAAPPVSMTAETASAQSQAPSAEIPSA
jgi:regulator of replication initiation timing